MKKLSLKAVAVLLLLTISCTKETVRKPVSSVIEQTNAVIAFSIGQHYGGGIIFYIDSTGQHGLIADTVDLPGYNGGFSRWWNGTNITTGANSTKIGSGKSNTNKIVSAQGVPGKKYAAWRCYKHKGSGYTDWFLPSKDELWELYRQKNVVRGFASSEYWSSTEQSSSVVNGLDFHYGEWYIFTKNSQLRVRAIRRF